MINIVPDTNVLISAIFWRGAPYKVIRNSFEGKYNLVLSIEIIQELIDKLRSKFKVPKDMIEQEISLLLYFCRFVEPKLKLNVVKGNSTDNKIIECAVAARADYIVTGDSHLKKLKKYHSIKILSPKEFLLEIQKYELRTPPISKNC